MSQEDYLRRQTQQQLINHPNTQKLQSHEADYFTRTTVNNEIDRVRREEEEKRRRG